MNLRQLFTSYRGMGKWVGAFFGYLLLGPLGALFGLLFGNWVDRRVFWHYNRPHWQYHTEPQKQAQRIFFEATFTIMGFIAKADGHVTIDQINMARTVMHTMHLNRKQTELAQQYFSKGKQTNFDMWPILESLRESTRHNPALLKSFIDIQFQMALTSGLSAKKQYILNSILAFMGFAPLHEQNRFYEDFMSSSSSAYAGNHQYTSNKNHNYRGQSETDHAYGILGIPPTASKQEVKRAYRRMTSLNHPDKLIAKKLPESRIKMATEKTQQIRKAYDHICAVKGW